jgi:hypothetical protein
VNSNTAKRVVVGSLVTIVVTSEIRRVVEGKAPNLEIPVGGLLAGATLAALAGPAPDIAATLAVIALVSSTIVDGPKVAKAVSGAPGRIGKGTEGQDYTNSTPVTLKVGGPLGDTASSIAGAARGAVGIVAAGTVGPPSALTTQWGTIYASPRFAAKLGPMIAAAAAAGHRLHGSAFRSNVEQVKLRQAHGCGGSKVYDSTCKGSPPTAVPGKSRHETGDAIDFDALTPAAFAWLQANASRFGIYNLPSERWHWSIDGH